jgi:hypothetical protein
VVGGRFYYIANSGWDTIEDDGTPKAGTRPTRAILMRADLQAKTK